MKNLIPTALIGVSLFCAAWAFYQAVYFSDTCIGYVGGTVQREIKNDIWVKGKIIRTHKKHNGCEFTVNWETETGYQYKSKITYSTKGN